MYHPHNDPDPDSITSSLLDFFLNGGIPQQIVMQQTSSCGDGDSVDDFSQYVDLYAFGVDEQAQSPSTLDPEIYTPDAWSVCATAGSQCSWAELSAWSGDSDMTASTPSSQTLSTPETFDADSFDPVSGFGIDPIELGGHGSIEAAGDGCCLDSPTHFPSYPPLDDLSADCAQLQWAHPDGPVATLHGFLYDPPSSGEHVEISCAIATAPSESFASGPAGSSGVDPTLILFSPAFRSPSSTTFSTEQLPQCTSFDDATVAASEVGTGIWDGDDRPLIPPTDYQVVIPEATPKPEGSPLPLPEEPMTSPSESFLDDYCVKDYKRKRFRKQSKEKRFICPEPDCNHRGCFVPASR